MLRNEPLSSRRGAPRLIDLFCGAGGATKGFQRAGFYVVGVDINPQPHYCGDEFIQADALEFPLDGFDGGAGSPPCQAFTHGRHIGNRGRTDHPRHIAATREKFEAAGFPYAIENVEGARAELVRPYMLCGSGFGLKVQRHRLFETNFPMMIPACQHGVWEVKEFPGTPREDGSRPLSRIVNPMASGCSHEDFAEAMDIDWMPKRGFRPTEELREAIPPAFTEHIGHYLMLALTTKAAA